MAIPMENSTHCTQPRYTWMWVDFIVWGSSLMRHAACRTIYEELPTPAASEAQASAKAPPRPANDHLQLIPEGYASPCFCGGRRMHGALHVAQDTPLVDQVPWYRSRHACSCELRMPQMGWSRPKRRWRKGEGKGLLRLCTGSGT